MFSRAQAKAFFVGGTFVCSAVFLGLSWDTFQRIPEQTNSDNLTEEVIAGKHLFDKYNCMGCHTILGEGGYYAPELTKVTDRRSDQFIRAMLKDPQAMYPGERKMTQYDFTEEEIDQFIAFFHWIGEMDLNGFPGHSSLADVAAPAAAPQTTIAATTRPKVFNQLCISCHAVEGQGGNVGPALDGIGNRMNRSELIEWLDNPQSVRPGTTMPDLPLTAEQITELAAYLSQLGNQPQG